MTRRTSTLAILAILAAPGVATAQNQYRARTAVVLGGPGAGQEAPRFSLRWAGKEGVGPMDQTFNLEEARGKTVVLAFYPRDFTEKCTVQMRSFAERYSEIFGPKAVVVGIGEDPVETHAKWAASLSLPFRLLSDPDQKVAQAYGSKDRGGNSRRTVYVVASDGTVRYRDMYFDPLDEGSYDRLGEAVRGAERR